MSLKLIFINFQRLSMHDFIIFMITSNYFFIFINQTINEITPFDHYYLKRRIHKVQSNNIKINQHSKESIFFLRNRYYIFSKLSIQRLYLSYTSYSHSKTIPNFPPHLSIKQRPETPSHPSNFSDQIPF